jgi:hypothetical protein
MLSFVRKGVLHQLLRLDPPSQPSNSAHQAPELTLTIESPMRLQSFASLNQYNGGDGGSRGKAVELFPCDEHGEEHVRQNGSVARFMGQVPCKKHSEEGDNPDGNEAGLDPSGLPPKRPNQACGDCSKVQWQAKLAELVPDKANDSSDPLSWKWRPLALRRMKVNKMDHISKDKDNVTSLPRYQPSEARLHPWGPGPGRPRVFMASFCLFQESAVEGPTGGSADAPPRKRVEESAAFEQTPSPQEIMAFVGIGPSAEAGTGTAAMWEAIFDKRQDRMDSECISELPEVRIVGRCLEKILGVDVVPAAPPSSHSESMSTLVSNMFLKASVDLKSLL